MIILIDGYNFLKTVTGSKHIEERVMLDWINIFDQYSGLRSNQVIIVFDAGPVLFEAAHQQGRVTVMYAGQYQTADDLLKKWLLKHREKDVLLVSSDREVRDYAQQMGIVSLASLDFNKIFNDVLQHAQRDQDSLAHTLYKTMQQQDPSALDQSLDQLMELGTRNLVSGFKKQEYSSDLRVRDGKKASKADRLVMKKVQKI